MKKLNKFLTSFWRNPGHVHFLGTIDRSKPANFTHIESNADPVAQIAELSKSHIDIYFACAEYKNGSSRKANNAVGAYAFWVDLDCGPEKTTSGKGYDNAETAKAAIKDFCDNLNLTQPNTIVISGAGLHCYWIFDSFVEKDQWQEFAKKFKALTLQHGLLADPTRTADIASVMRVPGTLNHKYSPPKPVELIHFDETLIDTQEFLTQIDKALDVDVQTQVVVEDSVDNEPQANITNIDDNDYPDAVMEEQPDYELDMDRLTSALTVLPPECTAYVWKFHRIAALANTAKQYPALAEDLFKLACDWSSGKLAGKPAVKWTQPSSTTGKAGKDIIFSVWKRFMKDSSTGKKTSAGTIYFHAHEAGWTYDDDTAGE